MTNSVPVNVPTISEVLGEPLYSGSPSDERTQRIAEALADAAPKMYKALCVLLLTPSIRQFLTDTDPMAFSQAENALMSVGGWVTVEERAAALGPWLDRWEN